MTYEVTRLAREHGFVEAPPPGMGEQELTRQSDLARLIKLAEEFDDGSRDVGAWIEWLRA